MSLQNNLRVIMAQKEIDSLTELMTITGLSRNALNNLWRKNGNPESVKLGTLMIICDSLNVNLSTLIEYKPD